MQPDVIRREIMSIARRRLECYTALAGLAHEQKSILMEGRDSELERNIAGHDPLLLEIMQLDRREETLRGGLTGEDRADDPDLGADYADLKSRTSKVAEELRRSTIVNREILSGRMEFVNFSLGLICRVAAEQGVTGPGNNPAILLDSRV